MTHLQLLNESAMMNCKMEGCTMNTFLNSIIFKPVSFAASIVFCPPIAQRAGHPKFRSNAKNPKFLNKPAFAISPSLYPYSYRNRLLRRRIDWRGCITTERRQ